MSHLINLGSAKDLFASAGARSATSSVWSGSISLGSTADEQATVRRAIESSLESINGYFVPVDFSAPTRCIDGRPIEGYVSDPLLHNRGLGPQVAGGTPAGALVQRLLLMGEHDSGELSFQHDIEEIVTIFRKHGLGFGGHVDDLHDVVGEDTGCGAVDKMPEILHKMVDSVAWSQLHGIAKQLLGAAYDETMVNQVSGRLLRLEAVADEYLLYDPKTQTYGYKQSVMKQMRELAKDNQRPVERLAGKHHERGIIINTVSGTTFDRDRYTSDAGAEMQLFNWDIWRSHQSAEILYPITTKMSYVKASQMLRRRYGYVLCRTLYTLATAMVLTDGTPLVLVHS